MGKLVRPYKKKENKMVTITVKIPSRQHEFIKKHILNPDILLQNAIKIEKKRISLKLRQNRKKEFNNEFKKIKPRIDEYIAEKRKEDPLWSIRYKHAKSLTRSRFISYGGGPISDKLLDRFISNYESLLEENKNTTMRKGLFTDEDFIEEEPKKKGKRRVKKPKSSVHTKTGIGRNK